MAYAAQADLLLRVTPQELASITDDVNKGTSAVIDETKVTAALDEASGVIDSYCRNRYQTPLQASNSVVRICRDLTIYMLYSRRPQKMQDSVRARYEDAIALLKDISTGKAQLDQPTGVTTPQTATGGAVLPTRQDLRFTDRDLKGFV